MQKKKEKNKETCDKVKDRCEKLQKDLEKLKNDLPEELDPKRQTALNELLEDLKKLEPMISEHKKIGKVGRTIRPKPNFEELYKNLDEHIEAQMKVLLEGHDGGREKFESHDGEHEETKSYDGEHEETKSCDDEVIETSNDQIKPRPYISPQDEGAPLREGSKRSMHKHSKKDKYSKYFDDSPNFKHEEWVFLRDEFYNNPFCYCCGNFCSEQISKNVAKFKCGRKFCQHCLDKLKTEKGFNVDNPEGLCPQHCDIKGPYSKRAIVFKFDFAKYMNLCQHYYYEAATFVTLNGRFFVEAVCCFLLGKNKIHSLIYGL